MSSTYDYRIYIRTNPKLLHLDPREHAIILHRTDNARCTIFTTTEKNQESRASVPRYVHEITTYERPSTSHDFACKPLEKTLIGYLRGKDLQAFMDTFRACEARQSQFTLFRWLWELVDKGLLKKADVVAVEPRFETEDREFGRVSLDAGK